MRAIQTVALAIAAWLVLAVAPAQAQVSRQDGDPVTGDKHCTMLVWDKTANQWRCIQGTANGSVIVREEQPLSAQNDWQFVFADTMSNSYSGQRADSSTFSFPTAGMTHLTFYIEMSTRAALDSLVLIGMQISGSWLQAGTAVGDTSAYFKREELNLNRATSIVGNAAGLRDTLGHTTGTVASFDTSATAVGDWLLPSHPDEIILVLRADPALVVMGPGAMPKGFMFTIPWGSNWARVRFRMLNAPVATTAGMPPQYRAVKLVAMASGTAL
jgi:hypothetical protein